MNSYRNFSPSPRNGWIIAWMSNYSVRFLRQREWDKVTLLLPLPPFRFIPHLTKPSSIETCIVINNFHRHHSKEKRKNIDTSTKQRKKKNTPLEREKEKKNDNRTIIHPNSLLLWRSLRRSPFTLNSGLRRFVISLPLLPRPIISILFQKRGWMDIDFEYSDSSAPPVLSRACNTG